MSKDGYYTDVFLDFGKKLTKQWTLNATVMYQDNNLTVVRGHGGHVRSGIFITEAKYAVNKNVQMRAELQYLYTPHDEGQWIFGLYELSLFRHWMIAAQDMYNIGGAPESKRDNYYTVSATWQYKAHRLMAGYTKTRAGYNCSGGVCRYVPKQEGVNITYNYSF